jgi:hypothetical protein
LSAKAISSSTLRTIKFVAMSISLGNQGSYFIRRVIALQSKIKSHPLPQAVVTFWHAATQPRVGACREVIPPASAGTGSRRGCWGCR